MFLFFNKQEMNMSILNTDLLKSDLQVNLLNTQYFIFIFLFTLSAAHFGFTHSELFAFNFKL